MHVHGDWGGTRLRLFLLREGQVIDRCTGPGIGLLTGPAIAALRSALAPWRARGAIEAILLCGMAGSRNGVIETPYLDCPADAAAWSGQVGRSDLDGTALTVAPGLACTNLIGAPDVMRGEETQIFGALAIAPALSRGRHLLVLPGTHSKWALIAEGAVLGFQTYLTGELFALLAERSSLSRAGGEPGQDPDGEQHGFDAGLARAGTADLLGAVFEARSAQLRCGRPAGWARGFLSGLLIGAELHAALAPHDPAMPITIIGEPDLSHAYGRALTRLSRAHRMLPGQDCALAGLAALADASSAVGAA